MSPRAYNRELRLAAAEEARRRIVEAAAALHATHGPVATSHAMIARQASVSIPTVYKYFPTANDLIPACTGLVAGRAPLALDERIFEGRVRVPERVRALAQGVFRLHEYFAPWIRWSGGAAPVLPALRSFLEKWREGQLGLIRRALQPAGARPPAAPVVQLALVLLDFPCWQTLSAAGMTSEQAAALAADAILQYFKSPRLRKVTP
jgi:AcrR family transcriptional regulator